MARMMKMDVTLNGLSGLVKENEELKKEIREMQRENMEDRREYFQEVEKVRKDLRVMEWWVRWIVEWWRIRSWRKNWKGQRMGMRTWRWWSRELKVYIIFC